MLVQIPMYVRSQDLGALLAIIVLMQDLLQQYVQLDIIVHLLVLWHLSVHSMQHVHKVLLVQQHIFVRSKMILQMYVQQAFIVLLEVLQ